MTRHPLQSRLLVPFGTKEWAADRVSISTDERGELLFDCPVSHVVLDIKDQKALRLNSDWYRLFERPPANEVRTSEDTFKFITEHMPIYCDVWDKFQQIFLSKYFEFVAQHVADHATELKNKLGEMGTLFSYQDWLMSAYLPLPQPLVYAPENPEDNTYTDSDMIRLPLMFWTGTEAIVLFFVGSNSSSSRMSRIQERLGHNGYKVVEIAQRDLLAADQSWMQKFMLMTFGNFWEAEVVPSGPFKPAIVDPKL